MDSLSNISNIFNISNISNISDISNTSNIPNIPNMKDIYIARPYFTHIILSGGGIKGICYLGIMRYLYIEKLCDNIRYIYGTSIGAYFSLIISLKIPLEFIENDIMEVLRYFETKEELAITQKNIHKMFISNGLYELRWICEPIIKYIKQQYHQDDLTFIELIKKTGINLNIHCTNVNNGNYKIFNAETTPNVSVIDAVTASMSIPFLFQPVQIEDEYYVDGEISSYSKSIFLENQKNLDHSNVLNVVLVNTAIIEIPKLENGSDISFIEYLLRILLIVVKKLFEMYKKESNQIDEESNINNLYIKNFTSNSIINFKIDNDEIKVDITNDDFENLILLGFIEITNFMNKKYGKSHI